VPIVAIWWFLLFFSGRAYRGLDGGRETGDDRAAPLGLKRSGKAAGDGLFVSRCKAEGGGKKPFERASTVSV
ncbi:hypothetical protein, partial [Mesorhizobium sp. M0633]|uniref:hypothetical protein n=2 Tax=unclassified Mesorhizobium TaxID=325217 RepID=UPI0033364480